MKKIVFALMLMMVISFSVSANSPMRRPGSINIQYFYDELAPYGDWIYSIDYGYVWRPYFDRPEYFRPYSSGGHWAYTSFGWAWVSDYNWGWATFHYGRWYFDDYLGWMWIPGYEWAPAWVSWGSYNDYWGWAPLGPGAMVGFTNDWYAPDIWWTFVPRRHFCSSSWNNHIYNNRVNITNITIINNVYVNNNDNHHRNSWYEGPGVNEVERYGHTRVRTNQVVDIQHPSDIRRSLQGSVNVYRPDIERDNNNHRPSDFRRADDVRSNTRIKQSSTDNNPGMARTRNERPQIKRNDNGSSVSPGTVHSSTNTGYDRSNNGSNSGRYNRPDDSQIKRNDASVGGSTNTDRRGNGGVSVRPGNSSSTGTPASTGSNRPDNSVNRRNDASTGNRPDADRRGSDNTNVRPGNSSSTGTPASTGSNRPDNSVNKRNDASTGNRPDADRRGSDNLNVRPGNISSTGTPASTGSNRPDNSVNKRNDTGSGSNSSSNSNHSVRTAGSTSAPSSVTNRSAGSSRSSSTDNSRSGSTDNSKRVNRPGR